jgi:hypothetical protein
MILVLMAIAMAERYVKDFRGFSVTRAGLYWAVLMLIIPLASIGIFGQ